MVFTNTILKCIDNSGALTVKCLRVLGKSSLAKGFPGDFVIVSIKTYKPHKKVKKGEIYKGVLARVKYKIIRHSNVNIRCSSNAVILLNKRELPLGSRVLEPVMREMRKKKHFKLLSMLLMLYKCF